MDTTQGTWQPSKNRGKDLLREVLELIEAQAADTPDTSGIDHKSGQWDQGCWGAATLDTEAVDAATPYNEHINLIAPNVLYRGCQTTACVAGHASLLVGDSPAFSTSLHEGDVIDWERVSPIDGANKGELIYVGDRAEELFQISAYDSERLFNSSNTLDDVRAYIGRILNDQTLETCQCDEYVYIDECATCCGAI